MKFTDLTEDKKLFIFTRVDEHTKRVQSESLGSLEAGINYLFLINAGGAVAVLSFLGAAEKAEVRTSPLVALAFFAVGVMLVGAIKAFRVHYFGKRSTAWFTESARFFAGEIDWQDLNERYGKAAVEPRWPYVVGYASFACFVIGALIGFWLLCAAG
jgi:hypothetical protein